MSQTNKLNLLRMSLASTIVHKIPRRFKQALRRNRQIDIFLRRSFALVLRIGGSTVGIESGPLVGLRLAISEHTSHTYIRGTYELDMQQALDRLVRPGDICYDLGASIGYMTPISDSERDVEFALTNNAYGSSIARDNKWPTLKLQTTTLDRFVEDHPAPNLLKIDVEDEEVRDDVGC